ncbi:MAG: hypothetical protein ABIT71_06290, partial [Vicinamibacteraceae bacterium]
VGSVVAGVLVAGVVSAGAQSLADVARKEEARRQKIAAPSKVYTDADAEKYAPAPGAQAAATTVTSLDASGKPVGQQATDAGLPADESGWRARLQNARDGVDRNRLLLSALEQQARSARKTVATDGDEPADDGSSRATEMKRLKAEMDTFRATLANAEEDARKAGVPPGWVR